MQIVPNTCWSFSMNGSASTHAKPIALTILTLSAWLIAIPGSTAAELKSVQIPKLVGTDGKTVEVSAPKGGATALIFYSSECPISNAYSPTLNRLADEFPTNSLKLVGICVDPDLSNADVATHANDFGFKFPVVRDRRGKVAAHLGATATPEAFLIDAEGRIRYHGRIDDQFADRQKR
ncbi:redoxin domain-containing protein, partial [Singulisphaera rosea]